MPDTKTTWQEDQDYEEYEIVEVELDRSNPSEGERGMWVAKLEFDFVLRWARGGGTPQPKVGQTCRVFGDIDGKWGPRGVVIGEKVAFFRTPEAQVEWVDAREAEIYVEAKLSFSLREKELQERLTQLPETLRVRIDAVRQEAEDKQRFDVYELELEIVKHEHGHMMTLVADDLATLETFSMIPQQRQMGYSWNAMCDGRRKVIQKMLAPDPDSDVAEDCKPVTDEVRAQLKGDLAYLDRYKEQRFSTDHPPGVLSEIFQIADALLRVETQHRNLV